MINTTHQLMSLLTKLRGTPTDLDDPSDYTPPTRQELTPYDAHNRANDLAKQYSSVLDDLLKEALPLALTYTGAVLDDDVSEIYWTWGQDFEVTCVLYFTLHGASGRRYRLDDLDLYEIPKGAHPSNLEALTRLGRDSMDVHAVYTLLANLLGNDRSLLKTSGNRSQVDLLGILGRRGIYTPKTQ